MSDGHRSGRSTGRVSCKSTELKRCSMIEVRWNKYEVSLAPQGVNTNSAAEFGNIIIIIIIINVSKRFTSILFAQLYTGRHRSRHCSEQISSSRLSVSLSPCSSFNPR